MPSADTPHPNTTYLRQSELFKGLDEPTLGAIAGVARHRQVLKNDLFFRQGSLAAALYVLVAGHVKLTQMTSDGHRIILRVAVPGDTFGTIAALGDAHYPVSARAADDCRALVWNAETLLDLMERFPHLAINALRVMSERVQEFQNRYRELASERVERRVARALLRLINQKGNSVESGVLIDLSLSRQDLAEMTGATLYTISRIISGWEQHGFIEGGRQRLLIKQIDSLLSIAEDLPGAFPLSAPPKE